MEPQSQNNFIAVILASQWIDGVEKYVYISEQMLGNGYPYPRDCREEDNHRQRGNFME